MNAMFTDSFPTATTTTAVGGGGGGGHATFAKLTASNQRFKMFHGGAGPSYRNAIMHGKAALTGSGMTAPPASHLFANGIPAMNKVAANMPFRYGGGAGV